MAHSILIYGDSGTGKSTSIRTLNPKQTFIINVNSKSLPFRGYKNLYKRLSEKGDEGNYYETDDSQKILRVMRLINQERLDIKYLVIDDFGYTFVNTFMRRAKEKTYDKFSDIASDAWYILQEIKKMRNDLCVFVMMHSEIDSHGKYKPRTIGNLVDKHQVIEGTVDQALISCVIDGRYCFVTNNDGVHTCHTSDGMFDELYIDNDLQYIADTIEQYNNEDIQQ